MQIIGNWQVRDDGVARPVIRVEVARVGETLVSEDFLIDSGADVTVFSAALLGRLDLPVRQMPSGSALSGVGGVASGGVLSAAIELTSDDGRRFRVRGDFAAFTDPAASDLSILGRDVTDHFDLILSRRREQVLLLGAKHAYRIEEIP